MAQKVIARVSETRKGRRGIVVSELEPVRKVTSVVCFNSV